MAEEFSFEEDETPGDTFPNPFEGDEGLPSDLGDMGEKEVKVTGVYEQQDQTSGQASAYVVLLKDVQKRAVPIWIGRFEAMAISLAFDGGSADRPLPYDTINSIISKMGGTVERILIDDLWNNTYYAKISITYDGKSIDADSRPSDAIALALRAKAPIFMAESVLQRAAVKEE